MAGCVGGRMRWSSEPGKPVLGEGLQDVADMLTRETQITGDAPLVPPLEVQAHHCPARPVRVVELVKAGHRPGQWRRQRMLLQEALEGHMVGLVSELTCHDAHQLAIVERRVELLEVEKVASHVLGVGRVPLLARGRAAVDKPKHALLKEAVRFRSDGGTVKPCLPAALGNGLIREEDASDDLILVLHGVSEAQG